MHKTKVKLCSFIILMLLCIGFVTISTLLYISVENITNPILPFVNSVNQQNCKVVASIGFAISSIFFIFSLISFSLFCINIRLNKKLEKNIHNLKQKFADDNNVKIELVNEKLEAYKKEQMQLKNKKNKDKKEVEKTKEKSAAQISVENNSTSTVQPKA